MEFGKQEYGNAGFRGSELLGSGILEKLDLRKWNFGKVGFWGRGILEKWENQNWESGILGK